MKTLLRTIEIWGCDTEDEATEVIEDAAKSGGDLTKKTVEVRTKKQKGEVIAERLKVTTQVDFEGIFDFLAVGGEE